MRPTQHRKVDPDADPTGGGRAVLNAALSPVAMVGAVRAGVPIRSSSHLARSVPFRNGRARARVRRRARVANAPRAFGPPPMCRILSAPVGSGVDISVILGFLVADPATYVPHKSLRPVRPGFLVLERPALTWPLPHVFPT